MSNKEKVKWTAGFGALSAILSYMSLENLLIYSNLKAEIIQGHLARAPEINEQVYQTALDVSRKAPPGDFLLGLLFGATAGMCGGLAIYCAKKK